MPVNSLYNLAVLKPNLKKKQNKTKNKKKATPVMQNIKFSLTLNDILLAVDKCHLECMKDQASLLF